MGSAPVADWRAEVRGLLGKPPDPVPLEERAGRSQIELPLQDIKAAVKAFRSRHWQLGPRGAFEFLDVVFPDRDHDEVLFGIFLLALFKRQLPDGVWPAIERWLDHIDQWVICDQLAVNLAGRLVVGNRSRFQSVRAWSQAPDPWRRRFAVMTACVVLGKQGCRPKDILRLIEPLMGDESAHVQNIVAWSIHQIARDDEALALSFLRKWKGRCNHEIFREASLTLSAAAKMALLKAKSRAES